MRNLLEDKSRFMLVVIPQTDDRIELKPGLGFVDYQTNMVKLAKDIARTAQDMVCIYLNLFSTRYCRIGPNRKHLQMTNPTLIMNL